jgi:S-(hydroxymethyl)glutathione dehydrogenase/alcohol dehydrogenase
MVFELENHSNRSLVVGGGGVGLFTVLALTSNRSKEVHLVESNPQKREIFRRIAPGVKIYADLRDSELIREIHSHGAFAEVYECTGKIESLQHAFSLMSSTGSLIFATHPREGEFLSINPHELLKGKKLLGSWGGGCRNTVRRDQVVELFSGLEKRLSSAVSEPFQLNDIHSALELARLGQFNRVLLELNP